MHDYLVDEAAEKGLLLRRRQAALTPQLRDLLAGLEKGRALPGAKDLGGSRLLLFALELLFGILEVPQRRLPASLQLSGHQAVVRVGLVVLPLRQAGLVAQPLDLLLLGLPHVLF